MSETPLLTHVHILHLRLLLVGSFVLVYHIVAVLVPHLILHLYSSETRSYKAIKSVYDAPSEEVPSETRRD